MAAIALAAPGGPEQLRLETVPVPEPGPDEVLIAVRAAGVNRADLIQRQGRYPVPAGDDPRLGLEVAGEVAALGSEVTGWRAGDAVCALTPGGGYAAFARAPAAHCLPIPRGWSMRAAACLPEAVATLQGNLFDPPRLGPGEALLLHGGSSGIGTIAIQMARLAGARVHVTAGSPEKCALCRRLGAETATDYRREDFVPAVLAATGGRGVDVVLDMVGGDYLARNLACLAPEGRHVSIAFLRGAKAELPLPEMMARRLTLTGSYLRPRPASEKARLISGVRAWLWPHLEAGELGPVIHGSWPLARAADAHHAMEAGGHVGKILLIPD